MEISFVDDLGYPGTVNDGVFDGGDSAAIIGTLIALNAVGKFKTELDELRSSLLHADGMVRHPDTSMWYGQVDRFSRDQLIPLLCSYIVDYRWREVMHILELHKKNWFLTAWNKKGNGHMDLPDKFPDITGPEVWALWIRMRVVTPRWFWDLLLPVFDLETLIGSIVWRFKSSKDRVTRNHMLVCLTGMRYRPTWVMRLAFRINDWDDLIGRWYGHCASVNEYPTADLFDQVKERL